MSDKNHGIRIQLKNRQSKPMVLINCWGYLWGLFGRELAWGHLELVYIHVKFIDLQT